MGSDVNNYDSPCETFDGLLIAQHSKGNSITFIKKLYKEDFNFSVRTFLFQHFKKKGLKTADVKLSYHKDTDSFYVCSANIGNDKNSNNLRIFTFQNVVPYKDTNYINASHKSKVALLLLNSIFSISDCRIDNTLLRSRGKQAVVKTVLTGRNETQKTKTVLRSRGKQAVVKTVLRSRVKQVETRMPNIGIIDSSHYYNWIAGVKLFYKKAHGLSSNPFDVKSMKYYNINPAIVVYESPQILRNLIEEYDKSIAYYCNILSENGKKIPNKILEDRSYVFKKFNSLIDGLIKEGTKKDKLSILDPEVKALKEIKKDTTIYFNSVDTQERFGLSEKVGCFFGR